MWKRWNNRINVVDEVLAGTPKYKITHADGTTEEVNIDLATAVQTAGTPLNKALFDSIATDLASPYRNIPSGLICMWSGSNVPTGWYLCNGQNGTPDLRDRFIVGSGLSYSIGNKGGEATHTLTVNEMPSHNHDFYAYSGGSTGLSYTYLEANVTSGGQVEITSGRCTRNTTSNLIANKGSGSPHENRPPYYALAFIMKA